MKKYIKPALKTNKVSAFFSNSDLASIAVDVSGSTDGEIMKNQKEVISNILSETKCENLLDRILAWNGKCTILSLKEIVSSGWTDPSCIFSKLDKKIENLLITTDGEISKDEVNMTRDKIKYFNNLKNIICISFQDNVNSPSKLNIAVFYPFLEHAKKMKGSFYLFFYKNKSLYLLIKNIPKIVDNNIFKSPPLEYNDKINWEEIPINNCNEIKKIEVVSQEIIEDGNIFLPFSNEILDLKLLEKDILEKKAKNDLSFVKSEEFNSFIKGNIENLIDACVETYKPDNFNRLRNIVSEWKKGLMSNLNEEKSEVEKNEDENNKNKKIELYNELMEKKLKMKDKNSKEYNKLKEQLKSLSKEIFNTVKEKIKQKTNNEKVYNKFISDIQERITEEQNKLLSNEVINDFTLKNITKVANRVKRAIKLAPIENSDNWDLSGNPLICDECLICARDDQPMALLMIDLSEENINLLEYNISDFALNDEINTGTKNICAIPAGEFCVQCAYAMLLNGKHPITRQKIGSVLVLADPNIKNNNKMILNSICSSIFGGREIKASFQILLGLFDELEKKEKMDKNENRFSPKIYDWIKKLVLYNTKGNLLPDDFGSNKQLIEAMKDLFNFKVSPYDEDTWLIPLRNKTINSMSIIIRNIINESKITSFLQEIEIKTKATRLIIKIFIKSLISRVINICKNKVNGRDNQIYNKMCFYIENDLFNNNVTGFPTINSEKICNFENSKMIKVLCRNEEEYKEIINSIKYFEEFIRKKFKKEEKFQLFSDNMITLITLGIYILINDEENINDLCKAEEDALLGFIGIINLKNNYSNNEKRIIELNKEIFLYGNTNEISNLTKENILDIIKSISIYSKIKLNNNNHMTFMCKYGSHLFSPCVTKCSVCGLSFITDEEISKLKENPKVINNYLENIKSRKYKHIQEFCYTTDWFGYNEKTNIYPAHKIVRIVCNMDKFKNSERPSREIIVEEINNLKRINKNSRGNIYRESLIKELITFTWDFIKRRNNLSEEKKKLISKDCLSFQDRILIEINEPQDDYIGVEANLDGLSEEEIKELSLNINLNEK